MDSERESGEGAFLDDMRSGSDGAVGGGEREGGAGGGGKRIYRGRVRKGKGDVEGRAD